MSIIDVNETCGAPGSALGLAEDRAEVGTVARATDIRKKKRSEHDPEIVVSSGPLLTSAETK